MPEFEDTFTRTTDHDAIRAWVELNGGVPGIVSDLELGEILDISFGKAAGDFEPISWDEFFDRFDTLNLVFAYTEEVARGEEQDAFSFISRDESEIEDETEFPELNELAEENIDNDFSEDTYHDHKESYEE